VTKVVGVFVRFFVRRFMLGRSFFDQVMIDALEYFTNQCVKW
jgi:hypothetical protein